MKAIEFSKFSNGMNVDIMIKDPGVKPKSALDAAVKTANEIRENFAGDLVVMCDYSVQNLYSQVTMQALKMAGVDFHAAICRLSNDLNARENANTVKFCKTHDIKYEFYDIDVPEFFESHEFDYYAKVFPTTQPQMTIVGKFFDLLPAGSTIIYPGFMMHVSPTQWCREKNNGFMPFVPHQTQENMARVSGKQYTNFQEHYVDMYTSWMFTESYGRVLKSPTVEFLDNAPHRYYQYEIRTIRQAGFHIDPTPQKLIGIEGLKTFFGGDKYDNVYRAKIRQYAPLLLNHASLQYTTKVDYDLRLRLEDHHGARFEYMDKTFLKSPN